MELVILSRKHITFKSSDDFPKKANGLFYSNEEFMSEMIRKAEELEITTSNMEYLVNENLPLKDSQFITIPVKKLKEVNGIVLICADSIYEIKEYENVFKYSNNNWKNKIRDEDVKKLKLRYSNKLNKIEPNFKNSKLCTLSTYNFSKKVLSYAINRNIELKSAPRYLVKTAKNNLYWLDEDMNENERENLIEKWEDYKNN